MEIIGDYLIIDGEKFIMTRNIWKLLNLANPGALNEYPEEDVSKCENHMF